MSVLARQAQREHIQQMLKLIDTRIRVEMRLAIENTGDRSMSTAEPSAGRLEHITAVADQGTNAVGHPGTSSDLADIDSNSCGSKHPDERPVMPTEADTTTDITTRAGTSLPCNAAVGESSASLIPGSTERRTIEQTKRGTAPGGAIYGDGSIHPAFRTASDKHSHIGRPIPSFLVPDSVLSRITTSLRYLQSGRDIPGGTFEGVTHNDLTVLDDLHRALSSMLRAIDRQTATIAAAATDRFERHMASLVAPQHSPVEKTVRFRGQEEWQTGGGRRIRWNPDAGWESDAPWTEFEVNPEGEPARGQTGRRSKLRHSYVPLEWTLPGS